MTWTQIIDPLHNLPLSGLVAAVPIFLIFWSLIKKMKGCLMLPSKVDNLK